jgi:PPM family protein phosphatase
MKVSHSARTDVGRSRDHNEDSYGVGTGEQAERLGELFVVCDGMGGHAAGEVASSMAVETILSDYYADEVEERPVALEQAFDRANEQIYAGGRGSMGTTGVAALLHHDALHVANVGDSRAYLIRDGEIRQITRDHSFVSDQVAAGLITPDQARSSPHRNVITRALGYQPEVSVDLFRLPLQVGDIILLCSDGLHGLVTDAEIAEAVTGHEPDRAVERLIELANQRGGSDNITVAIAHVEALDWDSQPVSAADVSDAHDRVTAELPAQEDETPPAAAADRTDVAPPVPAPGARRPLERRLTLLGGLLAMLLLSVLLFGILFALNQPVVDPALGSPTGGPVFAGSPAPAATATPGLGSTPQAAPTAAPSAGPSAVPTTAPAP